MAVTFMTGFEAQQAASDGSAGAGNISGTGSYNTNATYVRTGAASFRSNPASGASGYMNLAWTALTAGYVHFAIYIASAPSVERAIFGATGGKYLALTSTGTLRYYDNSGNLRGTTTATVGTGGWHWVGMRVTTGTNVVCIQIDGADALTASPDNTNTLSGFVGCSGGEASAIDLYFDDIIVDGAGFLGPSKVDIALPISDNTVTGVTDGNGGTSNLWECINNTPPAGVASGSEAATPTVNIRFPASANEVYSANLETYTTLGVGASDTIIALQWVLRHGEDIATGTKNGQLGSSTNPIIGDTLSFVFGDDGGAHAAETGSWKTKFGNLKTPTFDTIVLGDSPTLSVNRSSESRVGCIDFLGMLVAWTPAATAQLPARRIPTISQAVQRASSY